MDVLCRWALYFQIFWFRSRCGHPPRCDVFTNLLARTDRKLDESDKGRYTRRMIELWGDLTSIASDLSSSTTYNLFANLGVGWAGI